MPPERAAGAKPEPARRWAPERFRDRRAQHQGDCRYPDGVDASEHGGLDGHAAECWRAVARCGVRAERKQQRPDAAHAAGGPKTTLSRTSRVKPGLTISDPNRAASSSEGRATASCSPARSVNRISRGPSATRPSTDFFKSTRTGLFPSRSRRTLASGRAANRPREGLAARLQLFAGQEAQPFGKVGANGGRDLPCGLDAEQLQIEIFGAALGPHRTGRPEA